MELGDKHPKTAIINILKDLRRAGHVAQWYSVCLTSCKALGSTLSTRKKKKKSCKGEHKNNEDKNESFKKGTKWNLQRLDATEEKISEFEDRAVEYMQTEAHNISN